MLFEEAQLEIAKTLAPNWQQSASWNKQIFMEWAAAIIHNPEMVKDLSSPDTREKPDYIAKIEAAIRLYEIANA